MKKIFAIFLLFVFNFFTVVPAFADDYENEKYNNNQKEEDVEDNENTQHKGYFNKYDYDYVAPEPVLTTPVFKASAEDDKIYLDPKSVFELEFESDFDVNESKENDEIYFRLVTAVKASNGMYLPEHTRFAGHFKRIKKSSPVYKRARAYILIDKLLMPNEQSYVVRMEPKNGSDLKSPQFLNVIRAVPAGVGALVVSTVGLGLIAIESVSIVGLVVVPRTCKGFGLLISSMSKGLNYKAKAGSTILFKLDTPAYIKADDLKY